MSVIKLIESKPLGSIKDILELGCGDLHEAVEIIDTITGEYFAIDKIVGGLTENKRIHVINENYFDINKIEPIIKDRKFDLIFANYSLCFNKKMSIIECLPYYFAKIVKGGVFYVSDFSSDEQVVKKRNNLDDDWFFDIIKKGFSSFEIYRNNVFEKEHNHSHSIFELIAYK